MMPIEQNDWTRMIAWFGIGVALYMLSVLAAPFPPAQVIFYKAGHVTTLAWIGYWVARGALGRLNVDSDSHPVEYVARAILMGCVILGGSMGL